MLPFRFRLTGSERFAAFCKRYIRVPRAPVRSVRWCCGPWQIDLVGSVLDATRRRAPRAGCCQRSGQAHVGRRVGPLRPDAAVMRAPRWSSPPAMSVRPASCSSIATRMVELHPELEARVQPYKTDSRCPIAVHRSSCLPAEPKRLEGQDYTLAILDEIGVISRDTYEVMNLAQGKRSTSTLIGIGTPGPDPHNNVLADLRSAALTNPDEPSLVWREFTAAGFEDHPVDCGHCWELANPALDDFLHRDAMYALLPPKTREATYRRARLCQFVRDTDGKFLPAGVLGRPVHWSAGSRWLRSRCRP